MPAEYDRNPFRTLKLLFNSRARRTLGTIQKRDRELTKTIKEETNHKLAQTRFIVALNLFVEKLPQENGQDVELCRHRNKIFSTITTEDIIATRKPDGSTDITYTSLEDTPSGRSRSSWNVEGKRIVINATINGGINSIAEEEKSFSLRESLVASRNLPFVPQMLINKSFQTEALNEVTELLER